MLKGNKKQAMIAISEFITQSLKYGFTAKNPQSWNWQTLSEKMLLENIIVKSLEISEDILTDFHELPVDFVFGKLPKTKYLTRAGQVFYRFYMMYSFSDKKAQTQTRNAKKYFAEKLKILANQWSEQNGRGKNESRKTGKSTNSN